MALSGFVANFRSSGWKAFYNPVRGWQLSRPPLQKRSSQSRWDHVNCVVNPLEQVAPIAVANIQSLDNYFTKTSIHCYSWRSKEGPIRVQAMRELIGGARVIQPVLGNLNTLTILLSPEWNKHGRKFTMQMHFEMHFICLNWFSIMLTPLLCFEHQVQERIYRTYCRTL